MDIAVLHTNRAAAPDGPPNGAAHSLPGGRPIHSSRHTRRLVEGGPVRQRCSCTGSPHQNGSSVGTLLVPQSVHWGEQRHSDGHPWHHCCPRARRPARHWDTGWSSTARHMHVGLRRQA